MFLEDFQIRIEGLIQFGDAGFKGIGVIKINPVQV